MVMVQEAVEAAVGMDDGLGAFRPSTSFSDLTNLLNQTAEEGAQPVTPTPVEVVESCNIQTSTKKRTVSASTIATTTEAPPAKRKAPAAPKTQARRVSGVAKKVTGENEASIGPVLPGQLPMEPADTPNPLSMVIPYKASGASPVPTTDTSAPLLSVASHPGASSTDSVSSADSMTDEDFKAMAQAAVTNLISGATKESVAFDDSEKINTSTEHINALTGNNWVSACGGNSVTEAPMTVQSSDAKGVIGSVDRI